VLQAALLDRVRSAPGVQAAAFAVWAPMGGNDWQASIRREELAGDPADATVTTSIATIGGGYIEALRMPLAAGRSFTDADRPGAPLVAIVNQTLARRLWPDASPLGGRLRMGESTFDVIGVAADGKYEAYTEAQRPVLYLAFEQRPAASATLHVRSHLDGAATLALVRRELARLDPNIALEQAMPLSTLIGFTLFPQRMAATVIGIFGATGLLLAAIGLYGVLAFQVSSRTREIGIRMALGAPITAVIRTVMRDSLRLVLLGTALGLMGALLLAPLLSSLLYGITSTDPVTFIGGPLLLILVALAASYLPARRATRVSPTIALQAE